MAVAALRVAVIDNYDSFTYNLVQYLAELGARSTVHRNDQVTVAELARHDALVISPGPGTPADAGVSVEAVRTLSGTMPILGVCLGHQCLAEAFGGRVVRAHPVHGRAAMIHHDHTGLLTGLADPFGAARYHSLVVDRDTLPAELLVNAWTEEDLIMGLRHHDHPTHGLQFHPESVLTSEGKLILAHFLREA